jgi:tetratricopeptide (TPR) repeat protein
MTSRDGGGRTSAYAQALARSGHFREAAVLFELSTDPGVAGITSAARCLLMAGDPNAARESLDRVAPRWRFDGEIVRLRAEASLGAGAFEDAVAGARELTQAAPSDFGGLILLSEALLRVGEPDGALHAADRAVLVQPNAPDGYRARASAAHAMGDHDAEIEATGRALDLAPGDIAARRSLGEALVETGQRGEGQRQLAAVVAERPNDARASDALLSSSLPPRRLRWLLLALPVALPLLAAGVAAWTTHSGDTAWGAAFYAYAFTLIAIGVLMRRRADPMVRGIRRDVLRRARHGDFAAVRPFFSWAPVAIGACSMAAGVGGMVVPMRKATFAQPQGSWARWRSEP